MRRKRWLRLATLLAATALIVVPASSFAKRSVRRSQAQTSVSRRAVPVRLPSKRVARPLPARAKCYRAAPSPMRTQVGRVWREASKHPERLVFAAMP